MRCSEPRYIRSLRRGRDKALKEQDYENADDNRCDNHLDNGKTSAHPVSHSYG